MTVMRMLTELAKRAFGWLRTHRSIVALGVVASVLSFPKLSYAISLDRFFLNPFDSAALLLAGIINNITATIGKLMLAVIEILIVPILGYNGFSSADIVDLGWSLVRDVVNMGVVVILIVIAMQTIVGFSKANWTQQLPRLFIGVILVNFSRTICGVLIDISQVVMFTFVNAIIDIAAGNFAQMFGLSSFGEFSNEFIDKVNESGTGIEAYAYLGSAYLQLALYLAIFSVIALLTLMYIWRIVMLWLLVIMSPIAFFLNGIKGMFGKSDKYYGEWWEKFSGALIMGPLLTFFLWLALAASSGSNLAVTQDFPLPEEPGEYGLALENFSMDSLLGTFVALLLLVVGMQLSSASAAAIGGPVSKFISEDMGKKIVSGAVRMPGQLAGKGAAAGMRFADKKIGARIDADSRTGTKRGSLSAHLGAGGVQLGRDVSKIPVVGGYLGNKIASGGGALVARTKNEQAEKRKKAQETIKGMDNTQRDALIADMANDGAMFKALPKEQQDALHASLATDQKAQKRAEKSLGKTEYDKLMKNVITQADANKDDWFDDTGKSALVATKLGSLHNVEPKDAKPGDADYDTKKQKAIRDYLDDLNKDGKLTTTSARLIGPEAIKDANVESVLKGYEYRTDKDDNKVNIWSDISAGKLTQKQREAAAVPARAYARADFDIPAVPIGAPRDPARDDAVAANIQNVVGSGAIASMPPDAADALKQALANIPASKVSVSTRLQADEQLLNAGHAPLGANSVFGVVASPGTPEGNLQKARVEEVLQSDAENVRHFAVGGTAANVMTKLIVDNVQADQLKEVGGKLRTETGDKRESARKTLENVGKAITAEKARAGAPTSGPDFDRLERLERAHAAASRYMNLP
ncbi:MAG: hypothetical protein NUV56_02590 [Candidatus Uhrbacteria bacterium]|nr:hypothetical protein [Candidatus Uhrbacteria bacterium]